MNLDKTKFMDTLKELDEMNPSDHIMETLKMMATAPCPVNGGKKRRLMKGGFTFTKTHLKVCLYIIIAILASLPFNSDNFKTTVMNGLTMIYEDKCSTRSNLLWERIGFGNPVCVQYRKLFAYLTEIITGIIRGDPIAIAQLSGIILAVKKSPMIISIPVNMLADSIYPSVEEKVTPELNNNYSNNVESNSSYNNLPTATQSAKKLTNYGGRRKTHKRNKRNHRTRRSKYRRSSKKKYR